MRGGSNPASLADAEPVHQERACIRPSTGPRRHPNDRGLRSPSIERLSATQAKFSGRRIKHQPLTG
jgi:hypothetical protein